MQRYQDRGYVRDSSPITDANHRKFDSSGNKAKILVLPSKNP